MDPLSQKMMALRSDVTAQISRIASTRLSHLARPLRLSYSGDVLRVKPPLVEYEETLFSDGPGKVLKDSTFRIMDPLSQKMMALRSDVTAQISRIASTRLSHLARPLRLSYSGDVLRVKGDSFNTERQKTQVGAELIGLENEFCDAEIILICLKALKSINIENITIINEGNEEIIRNDKTRFLLVSPPRSEDFFFK